MVCTDVPHIVLHVSCRTRTSGGIFGPLKSDLGVFWPFRGTDFIMGKNKNANFSKSPHGPIFKFCVVIREAILQKMAPILALVNFFSVLTLLGHCAARSPGTKWRMEWGVMTVSSIFSTLSLLMRLSQGTNAVLPSKALKDEKPLGVCWTPAEGPT